MGMLILLGDGADRRGCGNMAVDNQYARPVIACAAEIRGTAICHLGGKCSVCVFARRYEHPEETPLFFQELVKRAEETRKEMNGGV